MHGKLLGRFVIATTIPDGHKITTEPDNLGRDVQKAHRQVHAVGVCVGVALGYMKDGATPVHHNDCFAASRLISVRVLLAKGASKHAHPDNNMARRHGHPIATGSGPLPVCLWVWSVHACTRKLPPTHAALTWHLCQPRTLSTRAHST